MIPEGSINLSGTALAAMRRLKERASFPGAELNTRSRRDLGEIVAIALKLGQSIERAPTEELVELMDVAVTAIAMRHAHPFTDNVRRHLKIVRDDISRLIGE